MIVEGLAEAFNLIFTLDKTLVDVTLRSLYVSGLATLLSATWSLPLALIIGMRDFPGRRFVKAFFNAMIGIPTVVLGLLLYLVFSRSGPLGYLKLLYTPQIITLGQAILITPILVSFTVTAVEAIAQEVKDLAMTLGASDIQASLAILRESRGGVVLSTLASFNRDIAELGVALMLGGNIRGVTRVLTTTIALETARGEITLSIALGIILLILVLSINLTINLVQGRKP